MVTTFRTVSSGSAGPKGALMDEVQRNVEHLFETQTVVEIREACTSLLHPLHPMICRMLYL